MNLGVGVIVCSLCCVIVRRIPVGEIEISTHAVELKSGSGRQIFQIVASSCADVLILLAAVIGNKGCRKFTIRILSIFLATIQSTEIKIAIHDIVTIRSLNLIRRHHGNKFFSDMGIISRLLPHKSFRLHVLCTLNGR